MAVIVALTAQAQADDKTARSVNGPRPTGAVQIAANTSGAPGDEFLLVDCLLPGQIRRLGSNMTYVTRQRPIRATPRECEIRGGEYVSYDRASYATAMKIWLPLAKGGDAKAQTFVGEIFEKGLGLKPDHAAAATWYRRAADQGFAPAQINLGYLYEKGLGVPKDATAALNLYRKASGLDKVGLAFVPSGEIGNEERDLRAEVRRSRQEADKLKGELERLRRQLDDSNRKLDDQIRRNRAEKTRLSELRRKLADARSSVKIQQERLNADRRRLETLKQEFARIRDATPTGRTDEQDSRVEELQNELGRLQSRLAKNEQAITDRYAKLRTKEKEISRKNNELKKWEARLKQMQAETARKHDELAALENRRKALPLAPPRIELIDPKIPLTRGTPTIATSDDIVRRVIVGRVIAPAGLMTLLLNGHEAKTNSKGVFRGEIPVRATGTDVSIVAIDENGARNELKFVIKHRSTEKIESANSSTDFGRRARNIHFGKYHALVIGNNKYKYLPRLNTSAVDAQNIADILHDKYGFSVTTVINGSRYEILSKLNYFREKLTPDDNLLVYYAGHGQLDDINQRGYWLPVDAERKSSANWISNTDISDILNSMRAKQVMVIADSCYSGALTRSGLATLDTAKTVKQRIDWIKAMTKQRSRLALTSGGLQPVMDAGGGKHSVFAKALIDVLAKNESVMEGRRVFQDVSIRVTHTAKSYRFEQVPEYAPIQHAGHSGGEFFFVAKRI